MKRFNITPISIFLIVLLLTMSVNSIAQSRVINASFELSDGGDKNTNWLSIEGWNSLDNNSGIDNNEFYAPVDGDWYAFQEGRGLDIYQETEEFITAGKRYELVLWARSINPAGNNAKTTIDAKLYFDSTIIVSTTADLNAPQLKGAAADNPNDDGANVWVDGDYRHQFADVHMYQPISSDPIEDPWLLVEDSNYEKLKGLGWAVGTIIVGDQKFIYGTLYRDKVGDFYSSVTLTKVLSTDGYKYTWSDPVTVLEHTGTEFPWVEDPHCFYDEITGRLWMAWGGGLCYVSELDPKDGMLINHPKSPEFDTHPEGTHTPVATWPETEDGWCGDQWSSCWNEGTAIYKHNGYWYYFASYGSLSDNYTIRYGRGTSPTGPFYDKVGVSLLEFDKKRNRFGNSMLLGAEGEQLVPGHPHIWKEESQFYMGYDFRKESEEEMDYMGIRKLYWVNDWPTIWLPVTVTFNADDYPEAIGKKLYVSFRNIGEAKSVLAVDYVSLGIFTIDGIK